MLPHITGTQRGSEVGGLFPTMIFNSHKAKTKESELGMSIKMEAVVSF